MSTCLFRCCLFRYIHVANVLSLITLGRYKICLNFHSEHVGLNEAYAW